MSVSCYCLFVVVGCSCVVRWCRSLFVVRCSLSVVCCVLSVASYAVFAVFCVLFVV